MQCYWCDAMLLCGVQLGLERARFLIEQAMDEDQQDNLEDAFNMYTEAAELCLKLVSQLY